MIWQFIINPLTDNLTIDDPVGWKDLRLTIKRSDTWHGVFFEYTTGTLEFVGEAYYFLKEQKRLYGIQADVTLQVNSKCNTEDEFELFYEGKLNFGLYKEKCGNGCSVSMPLLQTGCIVTFNNRYDQKVDIERNIGFNNFSALQQYDKLGFDLALSAVAVDVSIEGYVEEIGDVLEIEFNQLFSGKAMFRPTYLDERFNAIKTGQLTPVANYITTEDYGLGPLTPQLLYDDNINCFTEAFDYTARMKGSYEIDGTTSLDIDALSLRFFSWDGEGNIFNDATLISEQSLSGASSLPISGTFDHTFSGTITPNPGDGIYVVVFADFGFNTIGIINVRITFDQETSFVLTANKLCPTTTTKAFMLHETLSRAVEAITDNCLRVKSEYYGRTDSEPFAFDSDGCGSLRSVTNGLKLRQAPESKFFTSVKELFDNLNAIDNIGLSIENDPLIEGHFILRIEDVSYFYQDVEVITLDHISEGTTEDQEDKYYSKIEGGYETWEVEEINGLDEIHAPREYRSTLTTVNNTLNIRSKFVAGSYPIEITRQQSFVETGAADTGYDNETFIFCLKREGSLSGFEVEQGNVTDAENIYSPKTIYNWRIRPIYNLMRWFKTIAGMYPNISDSTSRVDFSAGEANYLAKGEMEAIDCKIESMPIGENETVNNLKFATPVQPIWRPEQFKAEYPLSVKDFRKIKLKPYGYLKYQCGAEYEKGYVDEIVWQVDRGLANFTLRKKYD